MGGAGKHNGPGRSKVSAQEILQGVCQARPRDDRAPALDGGDAEPAPHLEESEWSTRSTLLLQSAVLSHGAAGGLAASPDQTASADEVELSGDGESSEDEEIKARQRENPHLAIVTRKEYERILDWSDDEDMSTAQGRFNRRRKKEASYQAEHTTQCMMRAGEEGSVTDVSNGLRHPQRLLHAAKPDLPEPYRRFEVELAYTGRIRPTVQGRRDQPWDRQRRARRAGARRAAAAAPPSRRSGRSAKSSTSAPSVSAARP